MNVVCLVIDRLHSGYLGCYGNTWVRTPAFDRLASESFVFDQAYLDAPSLTSLYRSFWLGRHTLLHESAPADHALPGGLKKAGVNTFLLTDDPLVADHTLTTPFHERRLVAHDVAASLATEAEDTQLAHFFAEAINFLDRLKPPFLCWLHAQGLGAPWDAPWELRSQFREEGDPQPPDTVAVPATVLSKDVDPDVLLGIRQAYAGQVALLDLCWDVLQGELSLAPWANETLLVVMSARGFPLGLHRQVGQPPGPAALYSELAHIPWLVRFPDGVVAADRSASFIQPADLAATLLDWWAMTPPNGPAQGRSLLPLTRGETDTLRDRICIYAENDRAIHTPAWYGRLTSAESLELYAKPDDRWELNDVATRCGDVADALRSAIADYEQTCRDPMATLSALDEVLVKGLS